MNDKRFNFMFKAVAAFILVVFIAIISVWIIVGVAVMKTSTKVEEQGLKAVVEQIWCGPEKKCL